MVLRLAISLFLGRYHQYQHDVSGVDRVIQARAEPKLIPPSKWRWNVLERSIALLSCCSAQPLFVPPLKEEILGKNVLLSSGHSSYEPIVLTLRGSNLIGQEF